MNYLAEKRATTRFPLVLRVDFDHGSGWTRDVSSNGACIEIDEQKTCGAAMRFILNNFDDHGNVTKVLCDALVVRVEQVGDVWRIGVAMQAIHFEGFDSVAKS